MPAAASDTSRSGQASNEDLVVAIAVDVLAAKGWFEEEPDEHSSPRCTGSTTPTRSARSRSSYTGELLRDMLAEPPGRVPRRRSRRSARRRGSAPCRPGRATAVQTFKVLPGGLPGRRDDRFYRIFEDGVLGELVGTTRGTGSATTRRAPTAAASSPPPSSGSPTRSCGCSWRRDAPSANLVSEADLDAMKRRGWVERAREPRPGERRILVTLWHPCQTVGEGSRPLPDSRGDVPQPPARSSAPASSPCSRRPGDAAARDPGRAADARAPPPEPRPARPAPPLPARRETALSGVPWAADNDAFNGGWDEHAERRFLRMVEALSGLAGCLFVVCPDVVGDAGLTSMLFEEYAPLLWRHGLPPAYVLQEPGVEYEHWWIPWGSIRALFIGGARTEFKLGPEVEAIVAEARSRGVWVHMGRVNSLRRLAYAASIGCDSTAPSWSGFRNTLVRREVSFGKPR